MKIQNSKFKIQNFGRRGSVMIYLLITATIGSVILLGLVTFVAARYRNSQYAATREQSLQLAEAGVYWYRWYLAHKVEGKTVQQKKTFGRAERRKESGHRMKSRFLIRKGDLSGNIS